MILAALHDLALAGRAPALAAAYAAADGDAAASAAVDTLVGMTDPVLAIAVRRKPRTNETGHHAVLYPAIAEAARRVGADAVGLIDVGCSAGLNLNVDRVGITYSNRQQLGDLSSPVQLSGSIVGDRPIPTRAIPQVVARVGVDLDPVDVTDADDARWLRACLWPDQGLGVAPTIPTLGDRRASGHSIIGLAVFDHSTLHAEAIGRCWSQGRLLAWLTGH